MIKRLLVATLAALSVTPAMARVETGTASLMDLVEDNGVQIVVNGDDCLGDRIHGNYTWAGLRRQMNVCPGESWDATDHETVRHETWHAIQHCVNVSRGTPMNTPVQRDMDKLAEYVNEYVPASTVTFVKTSYTQDKWLIEIEAQLASIIYTADELKPIFKAACTFRM